jgi:GNAT superfamily N-acetyltransferase
MKICKIQEDLEPFLELGQEIYRDDPIWCGESREYLENMIGFMRAGGSFIELYMIKDGNDLTRASISIDKGSDKGFIGHFEARESEPEAVKKLFKHLEDVLKEKGARSITAPRSDIMSLGLQIDGFDLPQTWRTPHNPPYYQEYFESNGYMKKEDMFAYIMDQNTELELFVDVDGVTVRAFNTDDLENEIRTFNHLNNSIFSSHENFTERSLDDDMVIVGSMLPFMDEELVLIAEKDGSPIGFLICVPDHNQKKHEGKITRARLISIGILPDHTRQGIGSMMGKVLKKNLVRKGYKELEGSWVLESNMAPQKGAESLGASMGRVFRLYTKEI